MYIDTHCHLHDEKLSDTDIVVSEYLHYGVDIAINMACCAETSLRGKALSEKYPSVYFGAGCHPSDAYKLDDNELATISALADHPKCVAIGEIGLDYYWEPYDKEQQKKCFIEQIELAYAKKLPISIHCRNATLDTLNILREHRNKLVYGAVMHCFSGSKETASELLKLGLYISFAGPLTFKNANTLIDVAKLVPLDRCLTETDSPYLSPHPLRGKINGPKNVPIILDKLAQLKNMSIDELAPIIYKNAKNLFKKL